MKNFKMTALGALCLFVVTTLACSKKTAESGAASQPKASGSMAVVEIPPAVKITAYALEQPQFTLKSVQPELVNGRLNLALVSEEGTILQINDLAEAQLKNGELQGTDFRLVYLPGGFVPACTSGEKPAHRLRFTSLANRRWQVELVGEVLCQSSKLAFELAFQFEQPEPRFVAPNH